MNFQGESIYDVDMITRVDTNGTCVGIRFLSTTSNGAIFWAEDTFDDLKHIRVLFLCAVQLLAERMTELIEQQERDHG